ncbi:hypothetical protein PMAYCL1PPCAC_14565, partial [Pristionchus mayeri]
RMTNLFLLLASPLIVASLGSAGCVDKVDNVLKLHDLFEGKKDVALEDFNLLTYDNQKKPACAGSGKGKIVLSGYFKLSSGKIRVKKPVPISGAVKLGFNLEKNSMFVGTICKNGKSNNLLVADGICNVDLFSLASPSAIKQFLKEGVKDIMKLPGDWGVMKPMVHPSENSSILKYGSAIKGEWKVSIMLTMRGESFAGMRIGDEWIDVTTDDAEYAADDDEEECADDDEEDAAKQEL